MHYQTKPLLFESETFQIIIQELAQMDAVIIVPRDQITYGDVKDFASRSQRDDNEPWASLNWKDSNEIPMPPVRQKFLLRISAPLVSQSQKGKPVFKHSEHYNLAKETMLLEGLPLGQRSTIDALRQSYMKWKNYYLRCVSQTGYAKKEGPSLAVQKDVCRELRMTIENKGKAAVVSYNPGAKEMLQIILDSEYLETNGLYVTKFEEEMLFFSPDKAVAQAFLNDMPCSPSLDGIRKCIQDYLDDKTDIINSPDWF